MHAGNPALAQFIRETIRRQGPVTFEWFMEQALYHSEFGYYSSGRCAIGRRGDYFTNVSVGPLFGRLLAAQFHQMWVALGRPADFVIVEQGAHHGDLARDVLQALRDAHPDFFSGLGYVIIEPFPILRTRQVEALKGFSAQVIWKESVAHLDPFCGVHFSNELLDAMPVRLVSRTGDGWEERRVGEVGGELGFVTKPITDADLSARLDSIPTPASEQYETEINLAVLKWIDAIAQRLTRGFILAIDYGYARDDFYAPERTNGTLRCYSQHRVVPSPFTGIGEVDITAHVDWTSIGERAESAGLRIAGFTDQHHFITGIVTGLLTEQFENVAEPSTRRALQTLLHPELLGKTFQFLALTKNVAPDIQISGFKFARDPRVALGGKTTNGHNHE